MTQPHRRRTRLAKEERAGLILAAAIELIGERGFDNFSLKQLAERCDMSDAGLLHHFGSKEGLLVALLAERDRQDESAIAEALIDIPPQGPRTKVEALRILHSVVARNAARPELARLYTVLRIEALRPGHPASDFFARRDAGTMKLIAGIVGPFVSDPAKTARAVVAMMNGLALQWLAEDCSFDLVADWDRIAPGLLE